MNRIDYNQTGGFPLSTQILDAGQKAYWILNQYAYFAGNNFVIITGCEAGAGGSITDGYVVINGEPLPFKGTTITENVVIVEIADARGFEDGNVKPVIYQRYVTFGYGEGAFEWSKFRRPKTLFELEDELNIVKKSVPIGLVAVWGLPAAGIPEGWVVHTDFEGTVPVARKNGDVNFGAIQGTKIGTAQVTLTIAQMPKHKHQSYWTIGGGGASGNSGSLVDGWKDTTETGGDQSHTNIQPSTIVDYIRFVGFA